MANKVETLKEEEEELKRKVEQCRVRATWVSWMYRGGRGGSWPHLTGKEAEAQRGDMTCLRPCG